MFRQPHGEHQALESGPIVSIVTPSFNREDLIAQTLDSVLAQTWPHWEQIIVDDGSTDNTKAIIASYISKAPRISLYDRSRTPKGACTCRNDGGGLARGEYVMFLDTDDLLEPFCLEQRVKAMETDPSLDFAIFPGLMFEKTPYDLGLWWNIDKPEDELYRQFRQDAICQTTGVLWRKTAFESIGMWDENLLLWQDIDLFFRAYIQGYRYAKFFDLAPDLHNRVNPKSLSRCNFFSREKTQSRMLVVRRTVALLQDNGKAAQASEAKYMSAEIVSGASRSHQSRIALSQILWSWRNQVFSGLETLMVFALFAIYRARLDKLRPVEKLARRIESKLSAPSSLGRVAYVPTSSKPTSVQGGHVQNLNPEGVRI